MPAAGNVACNPASMQTSAWGSQRHTAYGCHRQPVHGPSAPHGRHRSETTGTDQRVLHHLQLTLNF
jgi:hypothetical protein